MNLCDNFVNYILIILFSCSIGLRMVMMINSIMFVIIIISVGLNSFNVSFIWVLNFCFWLIVVCLSMVFSLLFCLLEVIMYSIIGGNRCNFVSVVCRLFFLWM